MIYVIKAEIKRATNENLVRPDTCKFTDISIINPIDTALSTHAYEPVAGSVSLSINDEDAKNIFAKRTINDDYYNHVDTAYHYFVALDDIGV